MTASALGGAFGWKLVPVLACVTIVGLALGLTSPLLSLLMAEAGASNGAIGALAAMAAIATILVGPWTPGLTRRLGGFNLLALAIALSAAAIASFGLIGDWLWWFPLRLAMSAGLSVLFVLSECWINAVTPDAWRGRVMGVYAMTWASGFMLGPLGLSVLGRAETWPLFVAALVILASGIPVLLGARAMPNLEDSAKASVLELIKSSPATYAAVFAFGAIETAIFALLPNHGRALALDVSTTGLWLSAVGAGNAVLQVPLGALADRIDRRLVLMLCASVGVIGMIALHLLANHSLAVMIALFLWGGVINGFYTIGLAVMGERYRGGDLVAANAAFTTLFGWGALLGPIMAGLAMDLSPSLGLPVSLGAMSLSVLMLLTWRWWRLKAPVT